MNSDTAYAALFAAMRLTLCSVPLACGGTLHNPETRTENFEDGTPNDPKDAAAPPRRDASREASDGSLHADTQVDARGGTCTDIACCEEATHTYFAQADDAGRPPEPRSTPREILACCQTLKAHFDARLEGGDRTAWAWGGDTMMTTRDGCCHALADFSDGTCMAWGPPTPPASRARNLGMNLGAEVA